MQISFDVERFGYRSSSSREPSVTDAKAGMRSLHHIKVRSKEGTDTKWGSNMCIYLPPYKSDEGQRHVVVNRKTCA
jgi:hypothetical protein